MTTDPTTAPAVDPVMDAAIGATIDLFDQLRPITPVYVPAIRLEAAA